MLIPVLVEARLMLEQTNSVEANASGIELINTLSEFV